MSNSLERLSEERVTEIKRNICSGKIYSSDFNEIFAELKRLQAIEAERDELRKVIDRQHIQLDKYESLLNEGVNDHE